MNSKTVTIVLLSIIVISFIGYFSIKDYIFSQDSIYEKLYLVESYIEKGQWDDALDASINIETTWNKQKYILMLNMAEEDISYIGNSFHSIVAGIRFKDLSTTLANIESAKDSWESMNKLVPEP